MLSKAKAKIQDALASRNSAEADSTDMQRLILLANLATHSVTLKVVASPLEKGTITDLENAITAESAGWMFPWKIFF